jgi:hypothetical protein
MEIGEVPDPFGAIAEDDFDLGSAPAAIPGFGIEGFAELLGGFDRSGVGGESGSRMAKPSGSQVVWGKTHPSLTSRVWAG